MTKHTKKQLKIIFKSAVVLIIGLFILKWLPMQIWGENILFDASFHLATAIFILYIIWFFIDQNKKWHLPFFLFSFLVITIISIQRILVDAHNDIGLLAGFILAVSAILYSQYETLKHKLEF